MESANPNTAMANAWDGEEGEDWAREWRHHDRATQAHRQRLLAAAAVQRGDHVLDIGCGNGAMTRAAARAATEGDALGVDLSSLMLERAREITRAEGVRNATFVQADAQIESFEPGTRDLVVSCFGTMFFDNPRAAFANIRSALLPGGRFVAVVWRGIPDNEWQRKIRSALALGRTLPTPAPHTPGPFGLADARFTREVLMDAGFVDVALEPVDEPYWAGADVDGAMAFYRTNGLVRGLTSELSESDRNRALDALRAMLAEHATPEGVLFGSGAWLVSARNQ